MKPMRAAIVGLCLIAAMPSARAGDGRHWAGRDNGRDIAWEDAKLFCRRMGPGWRLPSVTELEALYGGPPRRCGKETCRLRVAVKLSGPWLWSGTEVSPAESRDPDDVAWGVLLVNGVRSQNLRPIDYDARALCVRGS